MAGLPNVSVDLATGELLNNITSILSQDDRLDIDLEMKCSVITDGSSMQCLALSIDFLVVAILIFEAPGTTNSALEGLEVKRFVWLDPEQPGKDHIAHFAFRDLVSRLDAYGQRTIYYATLDLDSWLSTFLQNAMHYRKELHDRIYFLVRPCDT